MLVPFAWACSSGAGSDGASGFANPGKLPTPEHSGPADRLPDLTVNVPLLQSSLAFGTEDRNADDCAVIEGCLVGGQGPRDVLRFDVGVVNLGDEDLIVGDPQDNLDDFEYSDCHQHYHHIGFADYVLSNSAGTVATGHKQAFCLMDIHDYEEDGDESRGYNCANQGISMGWEDIYDSTLDCQWVDITGLPPGDYTLSVTVNAENRLREYGPAPNTVSIPVTLPN